MKIVENGARQIEMVVIELVRLVTVCSLTCLNLNPVGSRKTPTKPLITLNKKDSIVKHLNKQVATSLDYRLVYLVYFY